jgi:nucleoside-diphosphate-sugar epimerase
VPVPRNIYGVTKTAAENLCELFHRDFGLPCIILRDFTLLPGAGRPEGDQGGLR